MKISVSAASGCAILSLYHDIIWGGGLGKCMKQGWVQVPTVHGTGALWVASLRLVDARERFVIGLTYSGQYWH